MAIMPLPSVDLDTPNDSSSVSLVCFIVIFTWLISTGLPARAIMNVVEYFSNLDLAQLSAIVDKDLLTSLQATPINRAMDRVGEASAGIQPSLP